MYKIITRLRSSLLVYLTHNMALPVLKMIRTPELFPYTTDELKSFSTGTLGNDLVQFLELRNLQLLPYYARHDIKHILLGYDTTDEGEGSLQCFMLGNRHLSFPVLATVIYCFITMPEYWGKFVRAFRRGRAVTPISQWRWFELLHQPTLQLQEQLRIPITKF